MNTIPNGNAEPEFQALMARLTAVPAWTEKQQLELGMARYLSFALVQTAETLCEEGASHELFARMQSYATVLDFMLPLLAGQLPISPPALRMLFQEIDLHVDEDYPE